MFVFNATQKQKICRIAIVGLFAWGFYLRFARFASRELWIDEIEQVQNITISLSKMLFKYLPNLMGGFPGDWLLTWPLAHLSANKWIITLPHVIATILGFYYFYRIVADEVLSRIAVVVALTMFVLNRELIFHAFEIRPYAVLPTIALAFYLYAKNIVQTPDLKLDQKIAWIFSIVFVLLFHSYGIVMVFTFLLYHLLVSRKGTSFWETVRKLAGPTCLAGLLASPAWCYYGVSSNKYGLDTFAFCGRGLSKVLSCVFGNLGDFSIRYGWVLSFLIVLGALFIRDHWQKQRIIFLITIILMPITLIFVPDVVSQYWFVQRQFIWVIPFWCLLTAHSVQAFINNHGRKT